MDETSSRLGKYPAIFKFYEDGKHRRYTLLFAVNGGVLAIAKGAADADKELAGLTLGTLASGMIVFTLLMGFDIWVFGSRMRKAGKDDETDQSHHPDAAPTRGIFSLPGKTVLLLICVLMVVAWAKVGSLLS